MRSFVTTALAHQIVREGTIVLCSCLLLFILETLITPQITTIRYTYDKTTQYVDSSSVTIPTNGKTTEMEVWATVNILPFQLNRFDIIGDNCLTAFDVNEIRLFTQSNCSWKQQPHFKVTNALYPGKNNLHFLVKKTNDGQIGFTVEPSNHPLLLLLKLAQIFIPLFWFALLVRRNTSPAFSDIVFLFFAGIMLRVLYVAVTPYDVRNYDPSGHIEYLKFVAQYWKLPLPSHGWEFHQGPLYYFLTAPLLALSLLLGKSMNVGLQWIQYVSLILSCLSLAASTWFGYLVFNWKKERKLILLFVMIMTFFPGSLMFASRINNDVLFQLIAFVFLGCLLRWWKTGEQRHLLLTAIVIGLGFLTKANSYLFAPILFICIIFRPDTRPERKIRQILLTGGIIALLAGWFVSVRYLQNDFSRLFLPGDGINSALHSDVTWRTFLVFNPFSIIKSPFAYLGNEVQHGFFCMFFFRTALYGEFMYSKILFVSRLLALFGLGVVLLSFIGIVRQIRLKDDILFPLLVILTVVLVSAASYRVLHPSIPNQDFRFSILVLPVFVYFAVRSASANGLLGRLSYLWLSAFTAISGAFILAIIMKSFS